jgi:hypothetical protein
MSASYPQCQLDMTTSVGFEGGTHACNMLLTNASVLAEVHMRELWLAQNLTRRHFVLFSALDK